MRAGLPASLILHAGVFLAGISLAPQLNSPPSTPMMVLPVELLEISDSTNVTQVPLEKAEIAETPEAPADPVPEPVATPEEVESIPEPAAAEKQAPKPEPEKPAETPPRKEPEKPKEPSFSQELDSILKSVDKKKPQPAASGSRSPASLGNVDETARAGVGDRTRMTVTVADFIRSQMIQKGCWNDQDDMADAKRLRTVIRVRFQRDGRLMEPAQLVFPVRPPANDPPMQIFVQRAFRAISLCTPFTVPPEYHQITPAQWIEIEFLP